MTDKFLFRKVYLPLVGCGLGGLQYERQVKPILEALLDDRFVVVSLR